VCERERESVCVCVCVCVCVREIEKREREKERERLFVGVRESARAQHTKNSTSLLSSSIVAKQLRRIMNA